MGHPPEPNPPPWPDSVIFISPDTPAEEVRRIVAPTEDPTYAYPDPSQVDPSTGTPRILTGHTSGRHFTEERRALLFHPGTYRGFDLEVGYYVQVAGLGRRAADTTFRDGRGPYVEALNKREVVGGRLGLSLDTFWRTGENFAVEGDLLWAVSQAAPLRRVEVRGHLRLHDDGAQASGGVLANAIVGGDVEFGSQQQYLCRSTRFGGPSKMAPDSTYAPAWNAVFVDCSGPNLAEPGDGEGADEEGKSLPCIVRDDEPKVVVEKPFVAIREDGETFELRVPKPRVRLDGTKGQFGPDLIGNDDDVRDFSNVKLGAATRFDSSVERDLPDLRVASKLQSALDQGKDVVLAPGIYQLDRSLVVRYDNQVILGLGLATLAAPHDGSPCIRVLPGIEGVRVAGVMLEASQLLSGDRGLATLLEWGDRDGKDGGNPLNPGVMTDIFARVGGSNPSRDVSTGTMVAIHSGNVYGDNLWLWRADHVALRPGEAANFPEVSAHYRQTIKGECPVRTGLEVNGDDVTIHGLAVEHTDEHQIVWRGERGNVQFYQCELPYDASPQFGKDGFLGYLVEDSVEQHICAGAGIYSNFRDYEVPVPSAIRHPGGDGIKLLNPYTVMLDNGGLIHSVVNGEGPAATEKGVPARLE